MNAAPLPVSGSLELWHGAHRWEPPFAVRPPKGGQAEHGAGLYLCCHRQTATKYAKGGGNLVHVRLAPDLRWLEDIVVSPEILLDAARHIPRLKRRMDILTDIESAGRRRDGRLGLDVLVNLAVNYDAMVGQPAADITQFLVSQGADASLYQRSSGDDWVVVFNPAAIQHARVIRPAEADAMPFDFDPVRTQLHALRQDAGASNIPETVARTASTSERAKP